MEEDAGKSIHDRFTAATAIDLNRAGVPLVEIVSEPDMRSSAEAGAYLRTLKQVLEYAEVSDVNMEEGSLRVDANVSARLRGETKLGTKTEVKNMNSFSGVERALEVEFLRQCEVLERDERVVQQTMLWDGVRREVRPARAKEGSHDYRYFPEPDLPPLVLTTEWIETQREALPELPAARRERFSEKYRLSDYDIDVLTSDRALANYFEEVALAHGDGKTAANWVMGEVRAAINARGVSIGSLRMRPADLARLLDMIRDSLVSNAAAKTVFALMLESGEQPEAIAKAEGLLQVSDDSQLAGWLDEAIAKHASEWERLRAGERKLTGVLVGAVMKLSGGRADPKRVNQMLSERASVS